MKNKNFHHLVDGLIICSVFTIFGFKGAGKDVSLARFLPYRKIIAFLLWDLPLTVRVIK
jgi:hypothetical protein